MVVPEVSFDSTYITNNKYCKEIAYYGKVYLEFFLFILTLIRSSVASIKDLSRRLATTVFL
jgi:hypothetical protein